MRSVRDQNFHKIAVAGGSTVHIAVTTPCLVKYAVLWYLLKMNFVDQIE